MRSAAFLLLATLLFAAEGTYVGKWASTKTDGTGEIRISVMEPPEVTFSLNGRQIQTTIAWFKADKIRGGTQIEVDYDFTMEGYQLRSALKGVAKGGKFKGDYTTKLLKDESVVDAGSVEATETK